ncbi:DUF3048 domain-containing protein [Candidatus Peregrinibacteria bacterium]|nr:DUF3048 domain-containing protein [Candidatus Peregrinibacteria bacterium]
MTKILSGLLLLLTIVVGWNISLSGTIPSTTLESKPIEAANSVSMGEVPDFLSRLSLLPVTPKSPPLIAIVIENHEDARPFQKGLDHALFISEFLVEGFISRFVALFSITDLPETVGPVRSLRPYFVDALQSWTSLFLYAGGSPEALEHIQQTTIPHINGLFLPEHFIRNPAISEPHNVFLSKKAMMDLLTRSPQTNKHSLNLPRGPLSSDQSIREIRVNFFNPVHNVRFTYDPPTASYIRMNGVIETGTSPRNILMIQAPIKNVGSYGRLDIPLEGTGSLLLFQSGKMSTGIWQKDSADKPFSFVDQQNQILPFANGQIWMMVLETLERVRWE